MEQKLNYVIGLDIGIGSVGWAAINLDKRRIEDSGVRLFDSGEVLDQNKRKRTIWICLLPLSILLIKQRVQV